jgi:hypothetical protein
LFRRPGAASAARKSESPARPGLGRESPWHGPVAARRGGAARRPRAIDRPSHGVAAVAGNRDSRLEHFGSESTTRFQVTHTDMSEEHEKNPSSAAELGYQIPLLGWAEGPHVLAYRILVETTSLFGPLAPHNCCEVVIIFEIVKSNAHSH